MLRDAYGDKFIEPGQVQLGDHALARKPGRTDITGVVITLTAKTATIQERVRFSPTGPWYEYAFKVPRSELLYIVRP